MEPHNTRFIHPKPRNTRFMSQFQLLGARVWSGGMLIGFFPGTCATELRLNTVMMQILPYPQ